jgi:hypothetical protein
LFQSARVNPIYNQLTARRGGALNRASVLAFAGIVLAGLLGLVIISSNLYVSQQQILYIIGYLHIALFVISPAIASGIAARMAVQALRYDGYVLLHLSPMPRETIVRGVLLAALSRMRWLWAVNLALSLIVACLWLFATSRTGNPLDLLLVGFMAGVTDAFVVGINFVAISAAISLAFRSQSSLHATMVTLLVLLLGAAPVVLCAGTGTFFVGCGTMLMAFYSIALMLGGREIYRSLVIDLKAIPVMRE